MINFLNRKIVFEVMNVITKSNITSVLIFMIVPVGMSIVRLFLVATNSYIYMNWNLFLALIPILFAWLFMRSTIGVVGRIIWFFLWMGFLPNAPYLITDLIHLADVGPRSLIWFDSIMLFGYAFVGLLIWLQSVHMIYQRIPSKVFIPGVALLTSVGIFMGRYVRHNTWDVVARPDSVFSTMVSFIRAPLDHEPFLGYITVFWLFLMFSYLGYRVLSPRSS